MYVGGKYMHFMTANNCHKDKTRLVGKGYFQVEGLVSDETFAPVARLESIHMLLAYATHHGFNLYQMDVKSVFLNDPIKEEVYVVQPSSFESEEYPYHVYKLHKELYDLKQAPRAWYKCLRDFLIENGFRIGKADSTLFTRKMGNDLFVCQIYVDDIIFGSTNKSFCDKFSKIMTDRFEMSMMRVLTFFLRFQIKQAKEGTFISQTKYTRDILKKFGTNGHHKRNVTSILHLANESSLFGLLNLKSKKECENPHHEHFKHIRHYFAKLIIKGFVSRTKYNIINIDLTYKQIFTHFSSEESRAGLTNPKTIFNKKVSKAFIPCSWYLLKSIGRLMEFIDMVRIFFTFKAGWLLHIHFFFDWTIQEGALDVYLIKLKTMVSSMSK
jgi:hypothetical protein